MTKFGVHGSPRPGVTLPQLEGGVDDVIAVLIAKGVSAEELERAKTRLIADAVYARDSQASLARWYGSSLTTGSTRRRRQALAGSHQGGHRGAGSGRRAATGSTSERSVTGYLIKDTAPPVVEKRS